MAVLYVREQGTMLCRRGERILVTKGGQTYLDNPLIGGVPIKFWYLRSDI